MLSKIFVFLLREHQRHVSFDYHDLSFAFPSKLLAICWGGEGFLWGGGRNHMVFRGNGVGISRRQQGIKGGGEENFHYITKF